LNRLIPVLLLAGTTALYLPRLGEAPMYVSHDEIVYSLQAQQLATTGRDLSGRILPMYIEYPAQFGRPTWDQPMLIYAIAAVLKVLPFTEFTIRLPMALLAILDVLLLYFVAKILFESEGLATAAAVLLALTPSHFMHSRQAIDFQLSLPFILGWLLCVVSYLRNGNVRTLAAAGAVLGVSLFGYVAAYVFVPIFALVTIAALWRRGDPLGRYGWFAVGLAAPAVICLPWMLRFPLPFRDVVAHYAVLNGSPSEQSGFVDVVRDFMTSSRVRELPALYASFFDPQFLFINGPLRSEPSSSSARSWSASPACCSWDWFERSAVTRRPIFCCSRISDRPVRRHARG
jgi:4-amino-4-deoxy-L-arabinose transferase-like glycosyltransferase